MTELRDLMSRMGTGQKSSEDMTYGQARGAFEAILDDEPADTTLGAFFVANRWKRNTPEELAGFVDAMSERVETEEPSADAVDCGANYDGKTETALLGVASGVAAAAAGTPVVVHSADRVPTTEGCAYRHVLNELGVCTDITPHESAELVDETGFGFYYQPRFASDIHDLLPRRRELGVRSFVNTVETLANPANADVHIGSFYHLAFATKVTETLERADVSMDRVVMFQGLEGYDDVRPGYTKVVEWENDELDDYDIRTADYGMNFDRESLNVDDVRSDSARITEEVLAGERDDAFSDAVTLNAAFRVYARNDAATLDKALDDVREVLRDGKAAEVLDELREVSR